MVCGAVLVGRREPALLARLKLQLLFYYGRICFVAVVHDNGAYLSPLVLVAERREPEGSDTHRYHGPPQQNKYARNRREAGASAWRGAQAHDDQRVRHRKPFQHYYWERDRRPRLVSGGER